MLAHLRALRSAVEGVGGARAFIGQVPDGTPFPYVSLSAPGHDVDDPALAGACGVLSADVRVMVVDTTESNVYLTLQMVRDRLAPGLVPSRLPVAGRHVELVWVRSEFVATDRSVTYGATNRHPGFGVDTYRIESQPA